MVAIIMIFAVVALAIWKVFHPSPCPYWLEHECDFMFEAEEQTSIPSTKDTYDLA